MKDFMIGAFSNNVAAGRAVERLHNVGYQPRDISVLMNHETRSRYFGEEVGGKAAEGAGVGAGIGGVLGAIIAGLTATGTIVAVAGTGGAALPLVAGPIAAALAGVGAGGISGGIIGALVGAGIPKYHAEQFQNDLDNGKILIGVDLNGGNEEGVREILLSEGAEHVRGELARSGM